MSRTSGTFLCSGTSKLMAPLLKAEDLLQIENAAYPVTVDALHTVFSPYGFVQKIAIFEKNAQNQVMKP